MKNQNYYFDTDHPPVLKGVEYLDNISNKDFPLYYKPFIKGVPTYLYQGHLFINGTKLQVENREVRELIKPLRKLSNHTKFAFDIVFHSASLSCDLYKSLLEEYGQMPMDYTIHIMDAVNPKMKTLMHNLARNSVLKAFKNTLSDHNHIHFHEEELVHSVEDLYDVVEASSLSLEGLYGAKLSKLKAYYNQATGGTPDAVIIDLQVNKKLNSIDMEGDLIKFKSGSDRRANVMDSVTVVDGSSIKKLDLSHLPKKLRKKLWKERFSIFRSNFTVETIEIPSRQKSIVKRILEIDS